MTITDVLVVSASMLMAYLFLLVAANAALPITNLASYLVRTLVRPFDLAHDRLDVSARKKAIEDEIARELGQGDPFGQRARSDVVRAAVEAQRIRVLDQAFRSTVLKCNQTHWAIADGLGATHMNEAARHPISQGLRQRVIDIAEILGDTIAKYPLLLDAPELVRLQVGTQRIAPTCISCPYWTATTSEAPRLCPPSRALSCHSNSESTAVDAEALPWNP